MTGLVGGVLAFVLEHWTWLAGGGGVVSAALAVLIPGAGPALAFLRANWKWLIPSAIAVAAGIYAGTQRINYLECKSARAADVAAAKQAALDALQLDAENVREVHAKGEAEKAVLQQEARDREDSINRALDGTACRDSGPYRALYDGVRQKQRAGGGQVPGAAGGR